MRCEVAPLFHELSSRIADSPAARVLRQARIDSRSVQLRGVRGSYLSFLLFGLHARDGGVSVVITPDAERGAYLFSDLAPHFPDDSLFYFPSSYRNGLRVKNLSPEARIQREELVSRQEELSSRSNLLLITTLEALAEGMVSQRTYQAQVFDLRVGERPGPEAVVQELEALGFTRVDFVFTPGQYARRGSIVDIFSYADSVPYRVDFLDDEIDSIRTFGLEDQLSIERVAQCRVSPEFSPGASDSLVWLPDLLPPGAVVWTFDLPSMARACDQALDSADEEVSRSFRPLDELLESLARLTHFELGLLDVEETREAVVFRTYPQPNFARNFENLVETLRQEHAMGRKTYIFAEQLSQIDRLEAIFKELGLDNRCYGLVNQMLHAGFTDSDLGLNVYTDHQIFERYHRYQLRKQLPKRDSFSLQELEALQPGDFVVHVDHGVGRFEGFVRNPEEGTQAEYVCLSYRDGDTLMVSIHNLHRLSKYRGQDGVEPPIYKLGSGAWSRLKQRVKARVKELARDLIRLYAARRVEEGFAFSPDTYMQEELEASFLFQDTPDQLSATRDVKRDMESTVPMDRLVCGDVGFGKTEVAIRAAFKAVADEKQVCVLVPTTVLALQHYRTFSGRLESFPCRVEYISRLRTPRQQAAIVEDLRAGRIDILIGTHALLRRDLQFRDLGLLIIDEEQKFGVAAKERLRQLRTNVDTLTLTATPIPRTLQFSLMGARDMSIISTPPPNRYPVHTEVMQFEREKLAEAIRYEVNRGGQVFFVHNWVQNLPQLLDMIREMVPGIRCVMAHGQMKPTEIERVMLEFMAGDFDLLLSTSIVESGLDIPNANTIIINNGHRFGLSDLHQLRGRVGRANRRAYCYIVVPTTEILTDAARRRLKAIEDYAELGSGMSISMQDLDIRGAGNLLGPEQSGFILDIGIETYQKILDEALRELKHTEFASIFHDQDAGWGRDCIVETDLDISLPDDYVESPSERMRLYRDIDRLRTEEELMRYESSLRDRFGSLPPQALELMRIPPLKWKAESLGIERLLLKRGALHLHFLTPMDSPFYQSEVFGQILSNIQREPRRFRLQQTKERLRLDCSQVEGVEQALRVLDLLGGQVA